MHFRYAAVPLFLAGMSSLCSASTINVPGTTSTIVGAVSLAVPGDEIVVAAGTYNEPAKITFTTNSVSVRGTGSVIVTAPDSADAVMEVSPNRTGIVVQNLEIRRLTTTDGWMRCVQLHQDTSTTLRNVTFNNPACEVGIICFNAASVIAENCTFMDSGNPFGFGAPINVEGASGTGYSDILMKNCTVNAGTSRWLADTGVAANPRIGNVTVQNCTFGACTNSLGVYLKPNTNYRPGAKITFSDCSFTPTANFEAMELHYTPTPPAELLIERCRFAKYDSFRGVMFLNLPSTTTLNNVSIAGGKHEAPIRLWNSAKEFNMNYCTIATSGLSSGESGDGLPHTGFIKGYEDRTTFTAKIKDCVFYSSQSGGPTFDLESNVPATGKRNFFISNSIVYHNGAAATGHAQVTIFQGPGYSIANPLLNNPGAGDVTLGAGSPAFNAGVPIPGITTDVLGVGRSPSAPDLGAYEAPNAGINNWALF